MPSEIRVRILAGFAVSEPREGKGEARDNQIILRNSLYRKRYYTHYGKGATVPVR